MSTEWVRVIAVDGVPLRWSKVVEARREGDDIHFYNFAPIPEQSITIETEPFSVSGTRLTFTV